MTKVIAAARSCIDRGRFKTAIMTSKSVSRSSVTTMRLHKVIQRPKHVDCACLQRKQFGCNVDSKITGRLSI
jgi:hypothetical protein